MGSINTKPASVYTHEGAKGSKINAFQELQRTVCSCLLWEDTFYESGIEIAERIVALINECQSQNIRIITSSSFVSNNEVFYINEEHKNLYAVLYLAKKVKHELNLRHVPLLMIDTVCKLAKNDKNLQLKTMATLIEIITRPDDLTEFLAIYWKGITERNPKKVRKLPHALLNAFRVAFNKFDEYQLSKYAQANASKAIKLRDVLRLCHPKPTNEEQKILWGKLARNELRAPETWERRMSAKEDPKTVFTELMLNKQLGALAFLRNLRNMHAANVEQQLIYEYGANLKFHKILPYQIVSAAIAAPSYEPMLEQIFYKICNQLPKFTGRTVLLIDVSGSMNSPLSGIRQSSSFVMNRFDAAAAMAIIFRELCQDATVFHFSSNIKEIPPRRGFALRDAIKAGAEWGSTYLQEAIHYITQTQKFDRLIIFTDEQASTFTSGWNFNLAAKNYIIDVAPYKVGVAYESVTHINGFSSHLPRYMHEIEELKV